MWWKHRLVAQKSGNIWLYYRIRNQRCLVVTYSIDAYVCMPRHAIYLLEWTCSGPIACSCSYLCLRQARYMWLQQECFGSWRGWFAYLQNNWKCEAYATVSFYLNDVGLIVRRTLQYCTMSYHVIWITYSVIMTWDQIRTGFCQQGVIYMFFLM